MTKKIKNSLQEESGQLNFLNAINGVVFTDEQKEFVNFDEPKSILLISTAGSGKTAVSVERMKELIKTIITPSLNILYI